MELNNLYQYAKDKDIGVFVMNTEHSFAMRQNGYHIALSSKIIHTERKEKSILAEEIAHCEYGVFYTLSDALNPLANANVRRIENIAKDMAAVMLVPLEEIKKAKNINELADDLMVETWAIERAFNYYKRKGLLDD